MLRALQRSSIWPKDLREAGKWAAGLVSFIAGVVGILIAFGILSGSNPEEALAAAARSVREAGSSKVHVEAKLPGEDGQRWAAKVRAEGILDYNTGRGRFRYDLELADPPERSTIEVRFTGSEVYVRPPAEWGLPPQFPWVGTTLERLTRRRNAGDLRVALLARLRFEDVSDVLHYLDQAKADVEEGGTLAIRGIETTRYDATIDLGEPGTPRAPESTVELSAWIDDHDVLRRMLIILPDGSQTDVELYAFGTPVRVATPPAAKVIDFDDLHRLP